MIEEQPLEEDNEDGADSFFDGKRYL